MTDAAATEEPPKKKGKLLLILGLLGAILGGGGGFFATYSELLFASEKGHAESHPMEPLPDVAFVAVPPIVVNLGPDSSGRHLRVGAQLEVPSAHKAEVETILPRVLDVLNNYLRAVEIRMIEDPASLPKIKAQMLRRIVIAVGDGRVRDLLISEFVVN